MRHLLRVDIGTESAILGSTELVIGRSRFCSMVIDDPVVSRVHASLRRVGEHIELADLGSANGTFVNGERIGKAPVRLKPGDVVKVGSLAVSVAVVEETTRERMQTRPNLVPAPEEPTGSFRGVPVRSGGGTGG